MKPHGPSDPFPGLRLQPRDIVCLTELGTFGPQPTEFLHQRHFPLDRTGVAARRRLRMYALHKLTDVIAVSVAKSNRPGRMPSFHRLTAYGADVIEHETGVRPPRPGRSDILKPHTLLHRAGMAQAALTFTDACRSAGLPSPVWHFEYDCVPNAPPSAPIAQRFLLRYDYTQGGQASLTCWPDALCAFVVPSAERRWELAIAWEFDRATETHRQIQEKIDAYVPWLQGRAYRRAVPQAADARIFFIVPSQERLKNLIASFREHPAAAVTRLAVSRELLPDTLLTFPLWRPLDGSPPRPIMTP